MFDQPEKIRINLGTKNNPLETPCFEQEKGYMSYKGLAFTINEWSECGKRYEQCGKSLPQIIRLRQNETYAEQVAQRRLYVKTIANVLLLAAIQNIAQHGYRKHNLSIDDFRKILELVVRYNKVLCNRFCDDSVITCYFSRDIQNEILSTTANMVREHIVNENNNQCFFCLD